MSHLESDLPSLTGISGPPQSATASAPATTIKSAHDTVSTNSRKFDSCEYTQTGVHKESASQQMA